MGHRRREPRRTSSTCTARPGGTPTRRIAALPLDAPARGGVVAREPPRRPRSATCWCGWSPRPRSTPGTATSCARRSTAARAATPTTCLPTSGRRTSPGSRPLLTRSGERLVSGGRQGRAHVRAVGRTRRHGSRLPRCAGGGRARRTCALGERVVTGGTLSRRGPAGRLLDASLQFRRVPRVVRGGAATARMRLRVVDVAHRCVAQGGRHTSSRSTRKSRTCAGSAGAARTWRPARRWSVRRRDGAPRPCPPLGRGAVPARPGSARVGHPRRLVAACQQSVVGHHELDLDWRADRVGPARAPGDEGVGHDLAEAAVVTWLRRESACRRSAAWTATPWATGRKPVSSVIVSGAGRSVTRGRSRHRACGEAGTWGRAGSRLPGPGRRPGGCPSGRGGRPALRPRLRGAPCSRLRSRGP